jgi:hypothetical protein
VLTRFAAFRNGLYARMEEISFRTSMTVLGGVVAVAAVIAGVGVLMSQSPAPARPAALSPAPASRSATPTAAPTSAAPSPSPLAPTSAAPARTPAPVVTSPASQATYPAADVDSTPAATPSVAPSLRGINSAAAAWWAWWVRARSGGAGHRGGVRGGGRWPVHR